MSYAVTKAMGLECSVYSAVAGCGKAGCDVGTLTQVFIREGTVYNTEVERTIVRLAEQGRLVLGNSPTNLKWGTLIWAAEYSPKRRGRAVRRMIAHMGRRNSIL